jgi:hypothetical protein
MCSNPARKVPELQGDLQGYDGAVPSIRDHAVQIHYLLPEEVLPAA